MSNHANLIRFFMAAAAFKALHMFVFRKRKSVSGKLTLVTGAASGVGRGLALELAKKGAKLVLWDVQADQLEVTKNMILKKYPHAQVQTDYVNLANRDDVSAAASRVQGDLDILINNAGLVSGNAYFVDADLDRVELTMRVNLFAHFYTVKEFLPRMIERNSGHIVSMASIAAFLGAPGMVDYAASKAGARMFAEGISAELHSLKSNVKVSCICPSHIDTALFKGFHHPISPTISIKDAVDGTIYAIEHELEIVCLPDWLKYLALIASGFTRSFTYEIATKLPIPNPMLGHNDTHASKVVSAMKSKQ